MKFSKLSDLPAEYTCNQCGETKPIDAMCLAHTRGQFELRSRCKDCHNRKERGHRREYKTQYQRAWRRRNKELERSYRDNDQARETNRIRMSRYIEQNREALAIQRRLRNRGVHITLAEAKALLTKYGRCYPSRYGLTPKGIRECERIRSSQRRRKTKHPLNALEIRIMVYEDGLFIRPNAQPKPYKSTAERMRCFQARKLNNLEGPEFKSDTVNTHQLDSTLASPPIPAIIVYSTV